MGTLVKRLIVGLTVIAIFIAISITFIRLKPITASELLWPMVENLMLDDFIGVTANGKAELDLFSLKKTGASTATVVSAAEHFITTLTAEQQQRVLFAVDDSEWRRWANVHLSIRQGVGFLEFSAPQALAARALISASLSSRGNQTATDIMRLEGHLANLMDDHEQYGEKRYWITIMGTPSATEPWGWQLDGHHLVINFFVLGDQVVMTPLFMGSEPPRADEGPYAGTEILVEELQAGLTLINALTPQQRDEAVINKHKKANNNQGELFSDNVIVPYQGLALSKLDEVQKQHALELIGWHINKIRTPHAQVKMVEIAKHWHQTYFAWVGDTQADAVFYYRVHSPVVMIEYDHQTPIALEGDKVPTRDHVHTVVRTPNGNDYGKDLLRQHLATHPHD